MITLIRNISNGENEQRFKLYMPDVIISRISLLFKLVPDPIWLTNESDDTIFPNENGSFDRKNMTELYVLGDPLNEQQKITPLNRVTNLLDTRGGSAPLNVNRAVGGLGSNSSLAIGKSSGMFGRLTSNAGTSQSLNIASSKPVSWKKSLPIMALMRNNKFKALQNVSLILMYV